MKDIKVLEGDNFKDLIIKNHDKEKICVVNCQIANFLCCESDYVVESNAKYKKTDECFPVGILAGIEIYVDPVLTYHELHCILCDTLREYYLYIGTTL